MQLCKREACPLWHVSVNVHGIREMWGLCFGDGVPLVGRSCFGAVVVDEEDLSCMGW